MTFKVAHWDPLDDDSLAFWYARGRHSLSVLIASVICVHFSQLVDHYVT
jgi:hypothetical protein